MLGVVGMANPQHAGGQGRKIKNSDVGMQYNKMLTQ